MTKKFTLDQLSTKKRHRTAAIPGTVTSVPNYPKKLKIYLNNASPYWWATYFDNGRTYRHSCKTQDKLEAYRQAREFYERLLIVKYNHPTHLVKNTISIENNPEDKNKSDLKFKHVVSQWITRKSAKWAIAHLKEVERRLKKNVLCYVGERKINKISRNDLLKLIQKIEDRGSFNLARRTLNDLTQIWHFAIVIGVCKNDITFGLGSALHQHTVQHFKAVNVNELPRLMKDISLYQKEGDEIVKFALQLIALTFVRKNELLGSRWDEFDLDKEIWKIPASRMKMRVEHIIPLSRQAVGLLRYIKKIYPSEGYVFYKENPDKPLLNHALIYGLYNMGYKNKMTVHGFRAIASTILNENNFRPDVIERQLAHSDGNQIRRAYNRAQYMPERIEMMKWWGDYLDKICHFNSDLAPENRLLF